MKFKLNQVIIWSRVGYDMDINDETTACVDDATCTDVRKPCEVKVGGTDISSNVILDFKTHNTLHVKAKKRWCFR